MIFAFIGIISSVGGDYIKSIMCLMAAGVCDMLDGAVASTKKRNCYEKHFGIQIDSMCDLISFGVLPAIFVYKISGENKVAIVVSCLYVLCGFIRLAYFNVQEFERQNMTEEKRSVYFGVPITTVAIVLPVIYLICYRWNLPARIVYSIVLTLLGCGFVAGIEIKKPKIVEKIVMIVVGILEILGVLILSGADIL